MIKKQTRSEIKGYLEGFIQGLINEHGKGTVTQKTTVGNEPYSKNGEYKPFHMALLPPEIIRINKFERSFSTKLGTTFEEVAKLIAKQYHKTAERGYRIEGTVSNNTLSKIEKIVDKFNTGKNLQGYYRKAVSDIVKTSKKSSRKENKRKRIADLYILGKNSREYYFEIKSPKPNKGQCLEALERLLMIHAIKKQGPSKVNTFYAMAYNPYGAKRSDYKHSFVKNYMDINKQVLIGEEFWGLVGGRGTYKEVLKIYQKVGKEKGPDLMDQLALGY